MQLMNILKNAFTAMVVAVTLLISVPARADWSDELFSYSDISSETCRITGAAPGVTLKGDIVIPTKVLRPSDGLTYTVVGFGYGSRNERFDEQSPTDVFEGQNKITSITFPATFTDITRMGEAFSGCTSIKAFYVENGNPRYRAVDGVLYSLFRGELDEVIKYPPAKTSTKYKFPETVTICEEYAFGDARYLTTVEFTSALFIQAGIFHGNKSITKLTGTPSSWKNIGNTMFVSEDEKTLLLLAPASVSGSFKVPSSITTIGEGSCCSAKFSTIDLNNVTAIEDYAFATSDLTSVTIPANVQVTGDYLFHNCKKLKSATFENKIKAIGFFMFNGCGALTQVNAPSSCRGVYSGAFQWCKSLKAFSLANYTSLEPAGENWVCDRHFADSGIESVNWPSGITEIAEFMFLRCYNLKTISLKESTKIIRNGAFIRSGLTEFNTTNLSKIEDYALESCNDLKKIVIADSDHELKLGISCLQLNEGTELYIDHKQIKYIGWNGGSNWTHAFNGDLPGTTIYTSRLNPPTWFDQWGQLYCPGASRKNYLKHYDRDVNEMFSYAHNLPAGTVTLVPNYDWVKIKGVTIGGVAAVKKGNIWTAPAISKGEVVVNYTANNVPMQTIYTENFNAGVDDIITDAGNSPAITVDGRHLSFGNEDADYTVTSMSGTTVANGRGTDADLSHLPAGIYIIRAVNTNGDSTAKITLR